MFILLILSIPVEIELHAQDEVVARVVIAAREATRLRAGFPTASNLFARRKMAV
ncbi:MAG: hypothetical protein NUW37_13565 [Planctomycetes bacterium]|nr:hypothetical protein [Planctomycetota bacterium]